MSRDCHTRFGVDGEEKGGKEMIRAPYVFVIFLCCNPINEEKCTSIIFHHSYVGIIYCWCFSSGCCLHKREKSFPPFLRFVWLIDFAFVPSSNIIVLTSQCFQERNANCMVLSPIHVERVENCDISWGVVGVGALLSSMRFYAWIFMKRKTTCQENPSVEKLHSSNEKLHST